MTESQLQEQVADYLRLQYPDVLFHSDFGSGIKLTPGQAIRQKRQNGGRRAWPDLFVAEPEMVECGWAGTDSLSPLFRRYKNHALRCGAAYEPDDYLILCGLYLELKKEGTRLKKKNGDWATPHIAEQAKVLEDLRERGYCAEFAVGFGEAKKIIDEYLGGKCDAG